MLSLQQGVVSVRVCDIRTCSTAREVSGSRYVQLTSTSSLSSLSGLALGDRLCALRTCEYSASKTAKSRRGMDQLAMPKAGPPQGLGDILNEGYELTDHVVVDENHKFDGNNDVIEKLITGFKTFKDGVFKYVVAI